MKSKSYLLVAFVVCTMLVMPVMVFAHPGGLDSSGCHSCKTNCAKWGLTVGEYHCHSGSTYSNSKGEIYDKTGIK